MGPRARPRSGGRLRRPLQGAQAQIEAPRPGVWGLNTRTQATLEALPMQVFRCPGATRGCGWLSAPPADAVFPVRLPFTVGDTTNVIEEALALGRIAGFAITPPNAATMSALFGSGGLGVQAPSFLAPARLAGNLDPTTPGFVTCDLTAVVPTC